MLAKDYFDEFQDNMIDNIIKHDDIKEADNNANEKLAKSIKAVFTSKYSNEITVGIHNPIFFTVQIKDFDKIDINFACFLMDNFPLEWDITYIVNDILIRFYYDGLEGD